MELKDAAAHVGDKVIYRAAHSPVGANRPRLYPDPAGERGVAEEGVITSVGKEFVFVRYAGDHGSKATNPSMLELLARS
jgi:hypothetical protein